MILNEIYFWNSTSIIPDIRISYKKFLLKFLGQENGYTFFEL